MKLSARNVLKGRVVALTPGAVNVEVVLEIAPGVQVVSIITKSSAESLGRAVGKDDPAMQFGDLQMHRDGCANSFEFVPLLQISEEGAEGWKKRKGTLVHEGLPDH